MKLLICVLALSYAIVYASDDLPWKPVLQQLTTDQIPLHTQRFPRQAEKGSINIQGTQPLGGQPSLDLNVNRNIYNNGRTTADAYGGLNKVPGQRVQSHFGVQAERNFGNNGFIRGHTEFQPRPGGHGRVQPHFGIQAERNFGNNGFIRGHTQFQPRPGGHGLSPSVGVSGGFRFRREAEPQGTSINFQGMQPLSGPMRQPSWDLNVNRNIYNNGRTTADVYGGLNKVPGQRVQPHFGVQAERNFGNNGFIRGHTQFQPRPGGHGLSPSAGVTAGFRFRRAAEDADEAVSAEEY